METELPPPQKSEKASRGKLIRVVSNLVDVITGKKTHEQRMQERVQRSVEAERFILGGIDQIKEKRYQEAVDYFHNKDIAKQLGVDFLDSRLYLVHQTPSADEINNILHSIGWHSRGGRTGNRKDNMKEPIIIEIAGVATTDDSIKLPEVIYHYWALTSAEEWLHVLQDLRMRPIAGFRDAELDVMAYFVKQGLKLEDMPEIEFTRRWRNREDVAQRLLKPDL